MLMDGNYLKVIAMKKILITILTFMYVSLCYSCVSNPNNVQNDIDVIEENLDAIEERTDTNSDNKEGKSFKEMITEDLGEIYAAYVFKDNGIKLNVTETAPKGYIRYLLITESKYYFLNEMFDVVNEYHYNVAEVVEKTGAKVLMSDKYVLTIADLNVMEQEGAYDIILLNSKSIKMPIIGDVDVPKTVAFYQIVRDN